VTSSPGRDLDQREGQTVTNGICEVIITADDAEWLASFTRALVDERLCACGHNIVPIRSIYRWQGAIQDEAEARVALHTRVDLVPRIVERTNETHPYEVPCVIAVPVVDGNPDYVDWVHAETTP
jgi:periplasmic divalent cation tolerance protein